MAVNIVGRNERGKDSANSISAMGINSDGSINTKSKIIDSVGNEVSITESGYIKTAVKENYETEGLLNSILAQLKIITLHLSIMTDININKSEVE